jgi:hypothetical protein
MKKRHKQDLIFLSIIGIIIAIILHLLPRPEDIKPAREYDLEVIREYETGTNRRVVQDKNTGECFHIDDYTGVNEGTKIDLEGIEFLDELEKARCTANE